MLGFLGLLFMLLIGTGGILGEVREQSSEKLFQHMQASQEQI